ncbi:MAG: MBOAT family protein [Paludibacteraceae bacterium]|nr:MBOAT family protein [Paludibacteraceae bacterium]
MVFNSFSFWLIYPILFLLYWAIPSNMNRSRNVYLLVISYLLYMNWKPTFAIVLLFVSFITYIGAKFIETSPAPKRLCIVFICLATLPLICFKYYNFINNSVSDLLGLINLRFQLPGLNYAIPVGISFFTFQAVGYVFDVYHKRIPAEKDIVNFMLFVSFFPQITSGPISKASELLPQIKKCHTFDLSQAKQGLQLLLWGMFLKVAIADRLGIFVDTVYNNYIHYNGASCLTASVFYTVQIYCDFAGYSLMAIGISKTIGFNLVDNFKRPYLATSITDFWKRWHISLTRWLTTHIYINLGGNRCPKFKQYKNIMVTFLVSGLWHGANWTFVIWGCIHGFLQIIEKILGLDPKGKYGNYKTDNPYLNAILISLKTILTFSLVSFAWIFFRMNSVQDALHFIYKILVLSDGQTQGVRFVPVLITMFIMLFGSELSSEYLNGRFNLFSSPYKIVRWGSYLFTFALVILYGVLDASQFIYVSF